MIRDLINTGSKPVANDLIILLRHNLTRNNMQLIEEGKVLEFDLEDENLHHAMEQMYCTLVDYLEKNYESR